HGGRPPVITDDMLHTVLRRRTNGESVEQNEVPRLLCLYVREAAGPEETGSREPALSFGGGAPRLLSRG
ncbi:hypothetical protein AB0L54_02600, partial [Streptomyces sp. NPDC052196]